MQKKALSIIVVIILLCSSLLIRYPSIGIGVSTADTEYHVTPTTNQANMILRARQLMEISWKCRTDLDANTPHPNHNFHSDYRYHGVPHYVGTSSHNIPFSIFLADFVDMASDSTSNFYSTDQISYGGDMSSFVSYAWGTTRKSIAQLISNYPSGLSYSTIDDIRTNNAATRLEIGDAFAASGTNQVLFIIADITRGADDKIVSITTWESSKNTPSRAKNIMVFRLDAAGSTTFAKAISNYWYQQSSMKLEAFLDRITTNNCTHLRYTGNVSYTHNCNVPLDDDLCANCRCFFNPITDLTYSVGTTGVTLSWNAVSVATGSDLDYASNVNMSQVVYQVFAGNTGNNLIAETPQTNYVLTASALSQYGSTYRVRALRKPEALTLQATKNLAERLFMDYPDYSRFSTVTVPTPDQSAYPLVFNVVPSPNASNPNALKVYFYGVFPEQGSTTYRVFRRSDLNDSYSPVTCSITYDATLSTSLGRPVYYAVDNSNVQFGGQNHYYYTVDAVYGNPQQTTLCSGTMIHTNGFYLLGDVNEDHDLDDTDASSILQHIVQLITLGDRQLLSADCNYTSDITAADAAYLLRHLTYVGQEAPYCVITPRGGTMATDSIEIRQIQVFSRQSIENNGLLKCEILITGVGNWSMSSVSMTIGLMDDTVELVSIASPYKLYEFNYEITQGKPIVRYAAVRGYDNDDNKGDTFLTLYFRLSDADVSFNKEMIKLSCVDLTFEDDSLMIIPESCYVLSVGEEK